MPSTGTFYIDALIQNNAVGGLARWSNKNISFGFMTSMGGGYFWNNFGMTNFRPFNATQQDGARRALALVADVADVTFSDRGNNDGDLFFGTANFNNPSIAGRAFYPGQNFGFVNLSGDVWLNHQVASNLDQSPGSEGFHTMMHEIGHALGLKHPGNYNNDPAPYLPTSQDNYQYSVMSYNPHPQQGSASPQTLMLYDIAAIQYLYGPNLTTRTGNDTYSWDPNRNTMMTLWDAGGQDTISAANQTLGAQINLNAGSFSSIGPRWHGNLIERATNNIAIAFGVTIENATGGLGHDVLVGNNVRNVLVGGAGNDALYGYSDNDTLLGNDGNDLLMGGLGSDTMNGGMGNDTYYIDSLTDSVIEGWGAGIDTVISSISTPIAGLPSNVENLTLGGSAFYGDGNSLNNVITGSFGNNALYGYGGNDLLNGGAGDDVLVGGADFDVLTGGLGSDTFKIKHSLEGLDRMTDYSSLLDTIQVVRSGFQVIDPLTGGLTNLAGGAISSTQFRLGTAALDRNDYFIYNATTGALFFDRDGSGTSAQQQIATLSNLPTLNSSDIFVG